jgi:predicted ribosome quality control (RQC) complex YloA/Tae2 family protein
MGAEKIRLFDHYRNQEIDVQLKKDVSPQKYAETLYRKSKNKHLELQRIQEQILYKQNVLDELIQARNHIIQIAAFKDFEPYLKKFSKTPEAIQQEQSSAFKTYEYLGFKIYIGRNSTNNDELTQKFAHKEDLWLHAKDVTGSHVVIKHQAGKPFPKPVIERAASMAAFYSKRKNDSLCPVIYTPKKYVRKVKGAPAGAVKIEREQIIMVVPSEG